MDLEKEKEECNILMEQSMMVFGEADWFVETKISSKYLKLTFLF